MSNESILELLKNNGMIQVACDFNSIIEGYAGLRRDTFIFTDNEKEFNNDIHTCILISENGVIDEEGLKVAYKHYLIQKMSLPHII